MRTRPAGYRPAGYRLRRGPGGGTPCRSCAGNPREPDPPGARDRHEAGWTAMRIDLHTHSSVSDGTETPAALMATARDAGLDVVALTDHDTTDGWIRAAAARPAGLTVVPGMELSCRWFPEDDRPISVHLLAYLFDPEHPGLMSERTRLRQERLGRGEKIAVALEAAGYPVSWERIVEASEGGGVGRPPHAPPRGRRRRPPAHRPRAGAGRGGRLGRRGLRRPAAPAQPALRRQARHRRPGGHRAGPRRRGSAGVPPRDGHQARPGGGGRRDPRHGRRRAARPRGR